jgi:perosamine synthetase
MQNQMKHEDNQIRNFYPVSEPTLGEDERDFLIEAFDSGWISSSGKFVDRAEEKLCELLHAKSVALTSNGTVALHLSLLALGITSKDEVLVPNLSYVAVPNSVLYVNATPILVDVNPSDFSMNLNHARMLITKNTKAIIAVHNYGLIGDMRELLEFASKHNLFVIEDCAEAPFLSNIWGEFHLKTFSFYGNKVVTSGEGGAVASNDQAIMERVRTLKNQGVIKGKKFVFDETGYNYRLTNLQAAVLFGQISNLEDLLLKRYLIFEKYNKAFLGVPGLTILFEKPRESYSPWLYSFLLDQEIDRDKFMSSLNEDGVETRPFFAAHSLSGRFLRTDESNFKDSLKISMSGVNLPTFAHLSNSDIDHIVEKVKFRIRTHEKSDS